MLVMLVLDGILVTSRKRKLSAESALMARSVTKILSPCVRGTAASR